MQNYIYTINLKAVFWLDVILFLTCVALLLYNTTDLLRHWVHFIVQPEASENMIKTKEIKLWWSGSEFFSEFLYNSWYKGKCLFLCWSAGFLSRLQLSRKSKPSTPHWLLSDFEYMVMINSCVLCLTAGLSFILNYSRTLDVCCKAQLIFSILLG